MNRGGNFSGLWLYTETGLYPCGGVQYELKVFRKPKGHGKRWAHTEGSGFNLYAFMQILFMASLSPASKRRQTL